MNKSLKHSKNVFLYFYAMNFNARKLTIARIVFSFIGLCFNSSFSSAQDIFPPKTYPQGYFRSPVNIPLSLAGNFGELRPNHYHMGFDVKTDKHENMAVYAAADGYVSRIKIEPFGFGRAIYINHPNGFTTVYCHLNDFNPAIENWVKQQQYSSQTWAVFLDLPAQLFPIKKGDFISYSGNTGGSQAPHVHFEVRNTASDVNLNPMLFGFALPDNTQPTILRLALYDRTKSTYEQSPKIVPIKKTAVGYSTTLPVVVVSSPKISFAITAHDTHSGSTNLNGIYEADLIVNNIPIVGFQMDNISYDNTRYLNAHIDYRTKAAGGPYLQHLSELPGYVNSIYRKVKGDGVIDISDGKPYSIKIVVKDAYNNSSVLQTQVQYNGAAINQSPKITAPNQKTFYPLMLDVFEGEGCEYYMGERCLYDSVSITYRKSASVNPVVVSDIHTIGNAQIPLQDYMMVRIKPNKTLSPAEKQRTVMQQFAGTKKGVIKVDWQETWAGARFRDFGSFQLVIDNEAPQILPIGFTDGSNVSKATRLLISVKDNLDEFKNFRAELDGKWLRFSNDKGRTYIYKFDEMFTPGEHTLMISVEDEAGNKAVKTFKLTR